MKRFLVIPLATLFVTAGIIPAAQAGDLANDVIGGIAILKVADAHRSNKIVQAAINKAMLDGGCAKSNCADPIIDFAEGSASRDALVATAFKNYLRAHKDKDSLAVVNDVRACYKEARGT